MCRIYVRVVCVSDNTYNTYKHTNRHRLKQHTYIWVQIRYVYRCVLGKRRAIEVSITQHSYTRYNQEQQQGGFHTYKGGIPLHYTNTTTKTTRKTLSVRKISKPKGGDVLRIASYTSHCITSLIIYISCKLMTIT